MLCLSTALDIPLALFFLSALGGLWAAYDRTLSWPMLAAIALSIAVYYMIINISISENRVWRLALCGMLGSLAVAVYFVTQCGHLEYPQKLDLVSHLRQLSRVFPLFTPFDPHPNSVAAFLEGWLPLAVAMTLKAKRLWGRVLMSVCTATLALAILLSASRGAWLALVLCLPLWWATRSRRNLIVVVVCGVALILGLAGYLLVVPGASPESIPIINRTLVPLFARPDRVQVYRGSWYLIQDFPFTGIGLGGTFAMVYSRYVLLIQVPFLTYSHNLFLEVWLNHGLLGVLALVWMIVAFAVFVWRASRRGDALFQGAWLGVAAILLHGLSDARQYADGWTLLSLFSLLGLAMAAGGKLKERGARTPLAWKLGGITGVGVLVVVLVLAWRPLAALAYSNAGVLSQARGELAQDLPDGRRSTLVGQAADHYERAIALDPDNRTAHQRLGILAMDTRRFDEAVTQLEAAYQIDPTNTTTRKALGLAYTWTGRLDQAGPLLADAPDIVEELNVWGWWWKTQGESERAANAYRMSLLLRPEQPSIRDALAATQVD